MGGGVLIVQGLVSSLVLKAHSKAVPFVMAKSFSVTRTSKCLLLSGLKEEKCSVWKSRGP